MDEANDKGTMWGSGLTVEGAQALMLVCDDDCDIADVAARLFVRNGFAARACYAPDAALAFVRRGIVDLAVLDVMLPGMDGFELARRIREVADIPIIFLTAKDAEADQVEGFLAGADDYVVKPYRPRELLLRANACLRRSRHPHERRASGAFFSARGIELDAVMREARVLDVPLSLTPKEFGILEELLRAGGAPVSPAALYEAVWEEPSDAHASNAVMVHVRNLRKKLAAVDSSTEYVETVWGVGYRIARDR